MCAFFRLLLGFHQPTGSHPDTTVHQSQHSNQYLTLHITWFWAGKEFPPHIRPKFSHLREGFQKKKCEKAVRLTALGGEGGSPPLSLTTSICENFDPFLSFIKRQNNPKYGNLSRNFHIFLTASGEGRGGSTQAVSLTAFSQFFF